VSVYRNLVDVNLINMYRSLYKYGTFEMTNNDLTWAV